MLNKMSLKLTSLGLGLMLIAGCQNQGPGHSTSAQKTTPPAATSAIAQSQQKSGEQAAQNILTVHLAQAQAEPELLLLDLGEDTKLYALPQPVLTDADMLSFAPIKSNEGQTFLMFEMSEEGANKLANISTQGIGHFFLFSARGQLVSVAKISEPITSGKLLMATENEEHTAQVMQLLQ